MSPLDLAVDAVAFAMILYRQRRVRRVRLRFAHRVPIVLSAVGLVQFVHYTETHSLGTETSILVLGSCVVGAAVLGALRAATVRLREVERGTVVQQAGGLTMALWVVSLGAHFSLAPAVAGLGGPIGVTAGSAALFLAVTLSVQNATVHGRALRTLTLGGTGPAPSRLGALDARSWEEPRG